MSLDHQTRRAVAAAIAGALVLTACGGGDGSDAGSEGVPPSPDPASEPSTAPASETGAPDDGDAAAGPLQLGYLLPETGPLASLGPGTIAATRLAVQDINEAGGVLGADVALAAADTAGDPTVASEGVARLLNEGVKGVIGAVSSAISLAVIENITNAEVTQCSGSNTSKTFTDVEDDGYYIRTAPSNVLQAPVLANTIIEDGATSVSLLVRSDDYGASIGGALEEDLTSQGATVTRVDFDPEAPDFSASVEQAVGPDPDAVVVVAFDEGSRILADLIERGAGPAEKLVYGTDGMGYATLAEQVDPEDPGILEGMKGTQTSSAFSPDFDTRLREFEPSLEVTNFAPYFYDCVVITALAAEAAGSADASDFADHLVDVTREGEPCDSFAACRDLLADGTDIDYEGVSGPVDFVDIGEPSIGIFDIVRFDAEGAPEVVDTVETRSGA